MKHAHAFLLAALMLSPLDLRAQQAGSLDDTFSTGGKVLTDITGDNDEGQDLVLQPDGNIVVAGISAKPTGFPSLFRELF